MTKDERNEADGCFSTACQYELMRGHINKEQAAYPL